MVPFNGYYNGATEPINGFAPGSQPNQNPYRYGHQAPQQMMQRPQIDPRVFETPDITMGESKTPLFKIEDEKMNIKVDISTDVEKSEKKRGRPPKAQLPLKQETGIIKADGEVVDSGTIYTYNETNGLLHETLGQIDSVNKELLVEFNSVRHNRTMKNKYMTLNGLTENISSLISSRIAVIREINNCISKSNEMDYKKYKDKEAAAATMNDDKYISDIYQAFIQNPQNIAPVYQMPAVDPSVMGSGIIRATMTPDMINNPGQPILDAGYLNYVANMTPEQNMMRFEGNPDIKQVVVYDATTGSKFFQVMNVRTGEVIPNVPVYDQMFMEDTTLDLKTGIAKNLNLNESFPIIQINNNITSQY